MLKILAFNDGRQLSKIPKDVSSLLSGKNMVWVDIENGSRKDFDFVGKNFGLHPLTIEDMRKSNSLPKLDILENDYMFLIFHELYYDRHVKKIKMDEVDFCVGKNFLITVHIPPVKSVQIVWDKVKRNPDLTKVGPDYLMHGIMDLEVDGHMRLMDELDEEIENLEDKLLRRRGNNVLNLLSDHRREIAELRKVVGPQRDIINRLSRGESHFISQQMIYYFRDIYDHIFRFYSGLEAHRDLLVSAFETYNSVQSHSVNSVIKQLTVVATIFLPLTFITSVYGMNFRNMPELGYEYGYYIVLAVMAAIAVGMWFYFRKKRY